MTARAVLQQPDIARALTRISHEILESNRGPRRPRPPRHPDPRRRSSPSASPRILDEHRARRAVPVGALDVTMYRDDLRAQPHAHAAARPGCRPAGSTARSSCSSTTCSTRAARIRAALDALSDLGRPARRAPRRARRPRPPRAADPRRLRRQEPAELARPSASTCASPRSTARPSDRGDDRAHEAPARTRRPRPRRRPSRILDVAEDMADVAAARGQEAPDPARQDRRQPVLRGLHPHPHLVRGRRQAPERRRHQLQREGLERLEGRVPQGHRADARGDGRGRRRHPPRGVRRARACSPTSGWIDAGVVNAGDGTHEHPTQALLDAFTIRKRLHGDATPRPRPRRRARDDRRRHPALPRRALERLAARHARRRGHASSRPPTLLPVERRAAGRCTVGYDLDEAIADEPGRVMMLRIQLERMHAAFFPNEREYARQWGLDDARLGRARPPIAW